MKNPNEFPGSSIQGVKRETDGVKEKKIFYYLLKGKSMPEQ